jgi:ABC-type amino acid transport substrate-binding protein
MDDITGGRRMVTASFRRGARRALACALGASLFASVPASVAAVDSPALQKAAAAGRLVLGYQADARPFSYKDDAGKPTGFVVALCESVAEAIREERKLGAIRVEWVELTAANRLREVQDGGVALACGPAVVTLAGRQEVSFSVPVFPSGIGALIHADAPARVREVLAGRLPTGPRWRGSPAAVLEAQTFAAVSNTAGERWLTSKVDEFRIAAKRVSVPGYDAGVQQVLDRGAIALFGDRAVLLDAARRHPRGREVVVLERSFSYGPIAIAMPRGDEDLRLLVDRALSRLFVSKAFVDLYVKWFGEPGETAIEFYRQAAIPE